MRRRLRPIALGCSMLLAACYEYRPATSPADLQGRRVQLVLTDSGAVVLSSRIGPAVDAVEGTYLGDSAGSHLLALSLTRTRSGQEADWHGERVVVARPLVASFLERRFSPSRTALAGGLATAGIVGITVGLRGRGEGGGGGPVVGPVPPR